VKPHKRALIKKPFLVILLLLALALGGCSSEGNLPEATTLHYAQMDEPKRLDPAFVKDLYEGIVSGFLYDGLVVFGQGSDVKPGLAERWDISPDGRVYTFHLRRGAKFSNGQPVTSADVRYSFTRILRPETTSQRKWVLDRIAGAQELMDGTATTLTGLKTPDDLTVRIELSAAYPPFLVMLAMPNACIIPDGSAGAVQPNPDFDRHPIGSGPWVLDTWLHDQRLVFRRNPNFWGEGPKLEHLVYHIQTEDSVRYRQFEAGNFDIIQIGFQAHEAWQNDPAKARLTTAIQELRTDYIGIICSRKPLDDVRVRAAISHGINREIIFRDIQKGRGVIAGGPVPPGIDGYVAPAPEYPFDPEKARVLLAQAGQQALKLTLVYREEPLNAEIAQAVKENLAGVGITVELQPRDQAALRQAIHEAAADMFLGSWTLDYPDIENALYPPFHSSNIPRQGNQTHFRNANVDEVLAAARAEGDNARRIALYQQAEQLVRQQAPWVLLFHRKVYYAVQPDVKGWTPALIYNADRFNEVQK
jgi:peptide/nickel transport system substrate-binding protein/oligopeptide transport system substrate-binding protein